MYTAMIVDDEYPARNMLDLLVDWEENDFRLIAKAENGKQALELYRKYRPDLLITDIQMPVMDGIQLIEAIRREKRDACMVILSCHESFAYAQQAIRLGVKDYLIKDMLTGEQLQKCLERAKEQIRESEEKQHGTGIKKFVLRSEPDETLKQAYPDYLSRVENRMDLLQSSLMAHDYEEAKKLVRRLYQVPFDGMVRYHLLNRINQFTHNLIYSQCRKNGISAEQVLGPYEKADEELLLTRERPEECCEILCGWIEEMKRLSAAGEDYSIRIQNVIKYLQENYFYDISLQSVAEQFGVHKVYLARTFKAETGQTLNEFLNKIRVEKAKLLLSITENKTSEIAYTVGFNNPQSFYNVFRKYAGSSPNEYRNQIRK
ncbi:MAG: response regulator [Candidatus Limivivens sp.]|nr:response regulator [Candidatus Limivivens sp.]